MSPIVLRVRELREASGLTQAEVAEASGVSIPTLSRMENGHTTKITLDSIDKLSTALDVDPGELFGRVGAPKGRAKAKR